ncbi:DNA internalization-related competence protein ComEC/Rec2 [Ramlibacter sp. AW1]|uniref:DNA internalization-related competence protein ComEC/Rec2 n=1 Tax=Ramlibacter aurantiacus TaxID=2801330 RepID=A0A936ZN91_9BURK|nr:DNA internalization-related competence protein ComEC/Rec2 [Ramlibacter aurantiacus]MBL0420430.1 DNA internalization-related competence protein ComEC/Rec2 [Ramlibacter aurantiacus]
MATVGAGRAGTGLAWVLGGVVAGAALQLQQVSLGPPATGWACMVAGLLLSWAAWRWRGLRLRPLLLLAAAVWIGFGAAEWRASMRSQQALSPDLQGRDLWVTGWVAGLPQPFERGQGFNFDIESARTPGGVAVSVPARVLLGWYADRNEDSADALPRLRAGDRWQFVVRLKAPHGAFNPHGFDAELWSWEQGLHAVGHVRATAAAPPPRQLGSSPRYLVERSRQWVRDAIRARIADPAHAGVVAALAVGDQRAISRADWDVFRATGVAHLVSISGLHVTLFAWLAAAGVGRCWRRSERLCLRLAAQQAGLVVGVLLATAYAVFSGWGVPSQRTIWMLAAISALRLSGLHWPWPLVWLLAGAVVVTLDPWALLQAGFWLSFIAVGVLFAAQRPAAGRLTDLLREQCVVTVALAPVTLLFFGQMSLVSLPANLVAIPWVTLVVTPLALAGVLVPPLWDLAGWSVGLLVAGLQVLAAWPLAVWSIAAPPTMLAWAAIAGGLVLVLRLPLPLRLMGLPLLLPVLLWQAPRPAPGGFELLAADVGQGSAVLVRTAGHSLLYDTGPRWSPDSEAGSRLLVPMLRALGERLDVVVVSHRDSDHSGGAAAVLGAHPDAQLWSSIDDAHELSTLRSLRRCEAGRRWRWDGVDFEFLHPQPADHESPSAKPNALSCVLRIAAGGRSALLAGDIERPQEHRLATTWAASGDASPLRADLLLVPHHGSRTSSSPLFLDLVRPRVALVQAGWANRFGHPAADVVARYRERGITVVSTVHCGAAHWRSREPLRVDCERVQRRRYWHHVAPGE